MNCCAAAGRRVFLQIFVRPFGIFRFGNRRLRKAACIGRGASGMMEAR